MLKRGFLKEGKIKLLIFGIIFLLSFIFADTPTELYIPNAPPDLVSEIPNQSWEANQSLINAFDLDDYFIDPEGVELTYYNSSTEDIYVSIDPTSHEVSFFPSLGFVGTRNVTFYASDSQFDTLSNIVYLFVGLDFIPPKWDSPSTNNGAIYQNTIVSFTTNWTDNVALKRYIFSINQGAGWGNYSSINFTGTENISIYPLQIMAPGGNTVYWRFFAFDSSENMNATTIQSFNVLQQTITPPPSGGGEKKPTETITRGGSFSGITLTKQRKLKDFALSESEYKISLKQGAFKTRVLKITNTGLQEINLDISSDKIKEFVIFSEQNFSIMPGKSKEITIDFNAPERAIVGQYFGHIIVKSGSYKKQIPVVLDIQGIDTEFELVLNLSKEYQLVKPGEMVVAQITLMNTKDLEQVNATLHYSIKDYEGTVYNFDDEPISFISDLVLERGLQVPEIAPEGKYLFYARAADNKDVAIDSVGFEVGTKFNFEAFFRISFLLALIILFALLLAIFMVKYSRDKRKERLLELYILLNKLKKLIKQKKDQEALELFIRIKKIYREPIPKEIYDDKERLKKEILDLYDHFEKDAKNLPKKDETQTLQTKGVEKDKLKPIKQGEDAKKDVSPTNQKTENEKK